jgi:hypothetical protein
LQQPAVTQQKHASCAVTDLSADGAVAAAELQDVLGYALFAAVKQTAPKEGHVSVLQVLLQFGADPFRSPHVGGSATAFNVAALLSSPAIVACLLQHASKQVLTAATMLDAGATAECSCFSEAPAVFESVQHLPPAGTQRQKAVLLVRAAIERTDSASIYSALQPGTAASSTVNDSYMFYHK